jgi:regulator of protease activity HflC (stomatin/prohibitin superfamily)
VKILIIIVAILAVLIVLPQTLFTVDQTKQAIVLQFGRPIATITTPGLKVKTPFHQSVTALRNGFSPATPAPVNTCPPIRSGCW